MSNSLPPAAHNGDTLTQAVDIDIQQRRASDPEFRKQYDSIVARAAKLGLSQEEITKRGLARLKQESVFLSAASAKGLTTSDLKNFPKRAPQIVLAADEIRVSQKSNIIYAEFGKGARLVVRKAVSGAVAASIVTGALMSTELAAQTPKPIVMSSAADYGALITDSFTSASTMPKAVFESDHFPLRLDTLTPAVAKPVVKAPVTKARAPAKKQTKSYTVLRAAAKVAKVVKPQRHDKQAAKPVVAASVVQPEAQPQQNTNPFAALVNFLTNGPSKTSTFATASAYAPQPEAQIQLPEVKRDSRAVSPTRQNTGVYTVSEKSIKIPTGSMLEAHSGFGAYRDDPASGGLKNVGVTTPGVLYELQVRKPTGNKHLDAVFGRVHALRLVPVAGSTGNRAGFLTHPYLLGPNGDSNGCISLKDYASFLDAYNHGMRYIEVRAFSNGDAPKVKVAAVKLNHGHHYRAMRPMHVKVAFGSLHHKVLRPS